MTSSSENTFDQVNGQSRGQCCFGSRRANWSGLNIFAMVLGFVFFWPIGLLVLYWILKGREVQELPREAQNQWSRMSASWRGKQSHGASGSGDNEMFNEYQQTQYDRIREIRDEIRERARRFSDFRSNAKRRADEEEFRRFMADSPAEEDSQGSKPGFS